MKTPVKKRTKIIYIILGTILLAAVAAGGFYAVNRKLDSETYSRQMKTAEKYMEQGDYKNAVLAYKKAIDADPVQEDAYEQIASAYMELSNPKKAQYYLKIGIERVSDSGKLDYMLKKIVGGKWTAKNASLEDASAKEEAAEEEPEEEQWKAEGTVIDAVTGKGVADAAVTAKATKEKTGGRQEDAGASVRTKANGSYQIELQSGDYVITVKAEGYVEETFELTVKDKDIKNQNFTISPVLKEGEIRIVLEWGAQPRDLDAYLFENTVDNTHPLYYGQKGSKSEGAMLDIDDTDGYGPETFTIYDTQKNWIYGVNDYTRSGTGLAASGVTVKVYLPGEEPKVYTCPPGEGDYWTVCRISSGNLSDVNQLGTGFF